jgi:hypothetical protein
MQRFKSIDNLPQVDETIEEHNLPKKKKKQFLKIRKKLIFSDKVEDKLDNKNRSFSNFKTNDYFRKINRKKLSHVCPIKEVIIKSPNIKERITESPKKLFRFKGTGRNSLNLRKINNWRRMKKLSLPDFKGDELDFMEPIKIKTINAVIVECEEQDEKEDLKNVKKHLMCLKNKRKKIDSVMNQLRKADKSKVKFLNDFCSLRSDKALSSKVARSVILENQDEYYSDE